MPKSHATRLDPGIPAQLFVDNRKRLRALLPANSLAVINANDAPPTNADGAGVMTPNSDLFYLTGVEQEQSVVLLFPDASDEKQRELLFLRETNSEIERWEGRRLTKEEARERTGIEQIHWLSDFPRLFRRLMCECGHVYLNSNEHTRAATDVETRDARFIADVRRQYPLHDYRRLAPLLYRLRAVKSDAEIALIRRAAEVTHGAFRRVLKMTRPGVGEYDIEAEFAHEFIRQRCRFAYQPIIASGPSACVLHYVANSAVCREGELLLLDVAARYANYNADMTRTIPVGGRFTPRQRKVYDAVLRVLRHSVSALRPGLKLKEWQKEAEEAMTRELIGLKLLTSRQVKKQNPDSPAVKKYFMHGIGHPLGLDVHDVHLLSEPIQPGWVLTVEPGIYLPEEGFAVRLENDIQVTASGTVDLMGDIPIEADEIESLMGRTR